MINLKKIISACKHPAAAMQKLLNKVIVPQFSRINLRTHRSFIAAILRGNTASDYLEIVNEIRGNERFNAEVNKKFAQAGMAKRFPAAPYSWPVVLYYLTRQLRPQVFVETGCFHGVSTAYILAALEKNNYGQLYTIDLPATFDTGGYYDSNPYKKEGDRISSLPPGKNPGFIVPVYIQKRWELTLGSTATELPKLLKKLGSIDFFLHDSLHSYENMMFEFKIAHTYLQEGGLIFSDNIDWNSAFYDFCRESGLASLTYLAYYESIKMKHNFGAVKK